MKALWSFAAQYAIGVMPFFDRIATTPDLSWSTVLRKPPGLVLYFFNS